MRCSWDILLRRGCHNVKGQVEEMRQYTTWVQIPAATLTSCVTLNKSINFSGLHQLMSDNDLQQGVHMPSDPHIVAMTSHNLGGPHIQTYMIITATKKAMW